MKKRKIKFEGWVSGDTADYIFKNKEIFIPFLHQIKDLISDKHLKIVIEEL